jgi:hypothetical protein
MRRRQRRLLNLVALLLLGFAIYINMFRMNDQETTSVNKNFLVKTEVKAPASTISPVNNSTKQ